ncbi:MAG: aminotransferase class I/II-fold pyridoxal phosphate-dependent enzyme [Bryobacteraceae bacterium]
MSASAVSPSGRVFALRPTAVNAILAEVREFQAAGNTVVSLMRGEPDFATPPHIIDACTRAMRDGRTAYPDNRGEKNFREAVAMKLIRDNALTYDPATEILATTGATFGIYAALAAVLTDGDDVLLPDPIYDAYYSPIKLCGGNVRSVTSKIVDGRFVISEEALEAARTPATKVFILNTPWNPVGTVLTQAELQVITSFCERHNIVLLSDEIYEAITYGGAKHLSPLTVAPQLRERAILCNSLSKTYAMTGWRVGYCAGPAPLIQAMYMILAQSSRGPATFVQDAAAEALAGPQDCVQGMKDEYTRRRAQVMDALAGIPGARVLAPEGGFFAMVDVRDIGVPSNEIRLTLMRENRVVVVHGSAYGAAGEGTLRVSFASGGENLAKGLTAVREGLIRIGESRR